MDLGILPGDMDAILRTGGQMLAVALLSAAVAAAGSWVTADLGARFGFEMRSLLLRKSQELSLHQFDEVGVSSMITRTTSDITNLQQTRGWCSRWWCPAPLIVGASIVMTAMVTPVMAVIQVGFMAALAAVAAVVLRKSNALSRSIQCAWTASTVWWREAVTGVRVIRAFGNEAYEEARSGDAYRSYADNMIRLNRPLCRGYSGGVDAHGRPHGRGAVGGRRAHPGRRHGGGADHRRHRVLHPDHGLPAHGGVGAHHAAQGQGLPGTPHRPAGYPARRGGRGRFRRCGRARPPGGGV